MLISATLGVGVWIEELLQKTMVAELGLAAHGKDAAAFERIYSSAIILCWAIGGVLFVVIVSLSFWVDDLLNVPASLLRGAQTLVIASGLQSLVMIGCSPVFNMYLVRERIATYNFWLTLLRVGYPLAALVVILLDIEGASSQVACYGLLSSGICVAVMLASTSFMLARDPGLRVWPIRFSYPDVRYLLRYGGLNASANMAMRSYMLVGSVIMNALFGLVGNAVFSLASQLSAYVRMAAGGMAVGLDAVAARMKANADDTGMLGIVRTSTLLHGMVVLPVAVGLFVYARPVVEFWVVRQGTAIGGYVDDIVALTRIMIVGYAAVSLSDGWLKVLYGAGSADRIVKPLVGGAVLYPLIIAGMVILGSPQIDFLAVALAFTLLHVLVHAIGLPIVTGRWLLMSPFRVIQPLLSPTIALFLSILVVTPLLWLGVLSVIGSGIGVALIYGVLCILLVFWRKRDVLSLNTIK